jgi:hypothetical protein
MGYSLNGAAVLVIGVAAVIGCAYLTHQDSVAYSDESQRLTGMSKPVVTRQREAMQEPIATEPVITQATVSTDRVAQWIAEAFDANPATRAAAIAALAAAPRSAVVPTLQRVLIAGEPMVDRPLALNSLRTLALQQGDGDGDVRDAMRQAIYDGSDDAISQRAQNVLEEVEAALDQQAKG